MRKRHIGLFKCDSESIQSDECDAGNVNVLASQSLEHSTKIEAPHQPQSNNLPKSTENSKTCDNERLMRHRKMKPSSSLIVRKNASWSATSIASVLRLGLTIVVIIAFLFSLTQIQNVEGQRNGQGQEEKIPNEQ